MINFLLRVYLSLSGQQQTRESEMNTHKYLILVNGAIRGFVNNHDEIAAWVFANTLESDEIKIKTLIQSA